MKTANLLIIFGTILMNCVAFYDFASVTTKGVLGIRLGNFGYRDPQRFHHQMSLVSKFFIHKIYKKRTLSIKKSSYFNIFV